LLDRVEQLRADDAAVAPDGGDIAGVVVGVDSDVVSLANGCICCTIREDLAATVLETIDRPERPEYLLLEASGAAEPSGIWSTFTADCFRDRIRMDSITCVVDAEQVFAFPELMELKIRQMAFADMIILNKVDLVDRAGVDRIKQWLDSRFHRYRLVEAHRGDVPLEVLLSVGRFDPERLEENQHHVHGNTNSFSTWSYENDQPLLLESLRETTRNLPATVYRAKGVIYSADAPTRRAVLQVVGKRVEISLHDEWDERAPRTQIVVIGAAGGIDEKFLHDQFQKALAPNQAR
jgi:G3E family GTPase